MSSSDNPNKDELIQSGYEAFASFERPVHFTDHTHCEECADHDLDLQNIGLKAFGPEQAGHIAWSPLPFLTAQALGYFMPRLVEMALNNMPNRDNEPFISDFILLVWKDDPRFARYTYEQREIIFKALKYMVQAYSAIIDIEGMDKELESAIRLWSEGLYDQ